MAIVIKDLATIKKEMQADLAAAIPQASQANNSTMFNLFVNPPAAQLRFLYSMLGQITDTTQLETASGGNLDRYASNYGLTRKPGTAATGFVYLILDNSFDNNRDITIPAGSLVTAATTNGVTAFRINSEILLRAADREAFAATAQTYSNQFAIAGITNAEYAVAIAITATVTGTTGVVGAYSITSGTTPNTLGTVNLQPTQGGFDAESDEALRLRISLVIAGNSVGTSDGVKKAALETPGLSSVFLVGPGDDLMTRDGTIYDEDGNLFKAGRGNAIDVYVYGQQAVDAIEEYVIDQSATNTENIDADNVIILGSANTSSSTQPKLQPVIGIGSVVGSQSGANFKLATEVTDEDGNVVLEGDVAFIKDFAADDYLLVRNTTTSELAVARSLNPNSDRYSVIRKLVSSSKSNSVFGEDRLLFLSTKATVTRETVTRGSTVNGSDPLQFTSVTDLDTIEQDVKIDREIVKVTANGAFLIQTRHAPIVSVSRVRHLRLGTDFAAEIINPETGTLKLTGRFAPQSNDLLEVTYVWRKPYHEVLEYSLHGDSVDWIDPEHTQENGSLTILDAPLVTSMVPTYQPLTPTFLQLSLSNAQPRTLYTVVVAGDIADVYNDKQTSYQTGLVVGGVEDGNVFTTTLAAREGATSAQIGQVAKVRNITRGFDYNLLGYAIGNNRYAPEADVNQDLAGNQFSLSAQANETTLEIGDLVRFGAPRSFGYWSSSEELTNNIRDNIQPVYDNTQLVIADVGEVQLLQPEQNDNLPQIIAPARLDTDATWIGRVRIDSDFIVGPEATLTINAGTVVEIVSSSNLPSTEEVRQRIRLNKLATTFDGQPVVPTNWSRKLYMFLSTNSTAAPFFLLLNSDGTQEKFIYYNKDIVAIVLLPDTTIQYYLNDELLDSSFAATIVDSLVFASLFATQHEEVIDSVGTAVYTLFDVSRLGTRVYVSPLDNEPRLLQPSVYDILIRNCCVENDIHSVAFDPVQGAFAVIPYSLSTDEDWFLEYGVTVVKRAMIKIEGRLVANATNQATPIIFTSFSTEQLPGDWEGIYFDPQSHSVRQKDGLQSIMRNCIVKYANIGIQKVSSDPIIDATIIKKYLSNGGISTNAPERSIKYRTSEFVISSDMFDLYGYPRIRNTGEEGVPDSITVASDTIPEGYGPCGYGYSGDYGYGNCENSPGVFSGIVSTSYTIFSLPLKPLTVAGAMPTFVPITTSRAYVDLQYGTDYQVFVDDEDITSKTIETFVDGSSVTLVGNIDFAIEIDLNTLEAQLVFYNTKNAFAFLFLYSRYIKRNISITYTVAMSNGQVTNSLIHNGLTPGWICANGSNDVFTNNTFFKTGPCSLNIADSYAVLRNNIFSEYSQVPIQRNASVLMISERNNSYSVAIEAEEPYRPVDVDNLDDILEIDAAILPINNVARYAAGYILKIDEEYLLVEQVAVEVRVRRGYLESTPAKHGEGAQILVIRQKTFFSVSGIPSDLCLLQLCDSAGDPLASSPEITMLPVTDNTFRIAIAVERSGTVFYRYKYRDLDSGTLITTNLRELPRDQFGSGVNDWFAVALESVIIRSTNYSADPQFVSAASENFELESDSPSNVNNPLFATPWDPNVIYNRFIGAVPHEETLTLPEHTRVVKLTFPLLASGTLNDSITILNTSTTRRLLVSSYNHDTQEITLSSPLNLRSAGEYTIAYNSATSLGTTIKGNPLSGAITYQYDAKRTVEFTQFKVRLAGQSGGTIRFAYRTSDRKDTIGTKTFSTFITAPESGIIDLLAFEDPSKPSDGSVIEFKIELLGNDGSFSNTGEYLYPRLQDFTLVYAPKVDAEVYVAKQVQYFAKFEQTSVNIELPDQPGVGITGETAANVSGSASASLWVQKVGTTGYFELAKVRQLNAGDTQLDLVGNFTTSRTPPAVDDIVTVDLSYISRGLSETVTFANSSTQITTERFQGIDSITSEAVTDRVGVAFTSEAIKIDVGNQPPTGTPYSVTYRFEAPKDGETIRVTFAYNSLIANAQENVDANKDALADILVREMFGIKIAIKAHVVLSNGFIAASVVANITRALSLFLDSFISANPEGGGRIDAMDTASIIKNVEGVDDLQMIEHHREGYSGITNIVLTVREFPMLDETSPEITIVSASDPNKLLSSES